MINIPLQQNTKIIVIAGIGDCITTLKIHISVLEGKNINLINVQLKLHKCIPPSMQFAI
jgi:hypothetical protein